MVNTIKILKYRKLENMVLNFSKGINIISGSNGTCKSSLLHIVSNSFQKIKKNEAKNKECISIISSVNKLMNPKIESLTRGDEEYNDPAPGSKGVLYECNYYNNIKLNFRRHNSGKDKNKNRFAIKPRYGDKNNEKLPAAPIIYLGLFRLFSYGEFHNDNEVNKIKNMLPKSYLSELVKIYKNFTDIKISFQSNDNNIEGINMGGIKNRGNFSTETKGIDSNTISAGEDNLYIILTALISLKYYFESEGKESILLIDELDAALHPAYQIKLYKLMKEYSEKNNIQIIFTTHSLSLIEHGLNDKCKVHYFMENFGTVELIEDISINKIEMWLKNQVEADVKRNKKIPVYTEDEEARFFLEKILKYYKSKKGIGEALNYLYMVNIKISSEALKQLFGYDEILKNNISSININSICILDGDQKGDNSKGSKNIDLLNNIIYLPSNFAPEKLFFDYSEELYNTKNRDFWSGEVRNMGFTPEYYRTEILEKINNINEIIKKRDNKNNEREKSLKGKVREKSKKVFNEYKSFFEKVTEFWIDNNTSEMEEFYKKLEVVFHKAAPYQKIDSKIWKIDR